MPTTSPPDVAAVLRESTSEHHDRAERQELQRRLVRGEVGREVYAAWLEQMLVVHRALEARLRELAARDDLPFDVPDVLLGPDREKVPELEEDLRVLGHDPEAAEAMPAARALCTDFERWARDEPAALLGVHYVLEGSTNGGRFIAKGIRRGLGLENGGGTAYLDPYGDRQKELWAEFKEGLRALPVNGDRLDAMVAAARRTFDATGEIGADVLARTEPPAE